MTVPKEDAQSTSFKNHPLLKVPVKIENPALLKPQSAFEIYFGQFPDFGARGRFFHIYFTALDINFERIHKTIPFYSKDMFNISSVIKSIENACFFVEVVICGWQEIASKEDFNIVYASAINNNTYHCHDIKMSDTMEGAPSYYHVNYVFDHISHGCVFGDIPIKANGIINLHEIEQFIIDVHRVPAALVHIIRWIKLDSYEDFCELNDIKPLYPLIGL